MKKQAGISLIGLIFGLIGLIYIVLLAIRIVPVYTEHYAIKSVLNSLRIEDPKNITAPIKIEDMLIRRFSVNNITHVGRDHIFIEARANKKYSVSIRYDVKVSLFGNLSLLANFDDQVEVSH
ncbi:MAG: DUF4845 domain-containing protein [Gammaproteobacteria bacterium]|nr:DUF4845 domain-containing protein [Gammaproteobacteria bacterium]